MVIGAPAAVGQVLDEVDLPVAGFDSRLHHLLEFRPGPGEEGRNGLRHHVVLLHKGIAAVALVQPQAQVALALIEPDELRDVGGCNTPC